MAANKLEAVECSLRGDFKGVVLTKSPSGDLTVDVSALNGVNVTIIADGDGKIVKQPPVEEQTNTPDVIEASPTAAAFKPANAMIPAGQVQFNKISPYLTDLPDEARAELLVSPKDTAVILERGLGRWIEDVQGIRSINEAHGLHFDGQILTGMQVFDKYEDGYSNAIEKEIAGQLRSAWEQAKDSGEDVTTGLFMGTKQIVHGCESGTRDVTVLNNLYSRREAIAEQGDKFVTERGSDDAHWQFTSTEFPNVSFEVYSIDFTDSVASWDQKSDCHCSSRPVALRVSAPILDLLRVGC